MPLKYALYPGCAAKGATPELYQSTMAIIGRLGIEVVELTAASCCGVGVVDEAEPDVALQALGAPPGLLGTHPPHSPDPESQGLARSFQDDTDRQGSLPAAVGVLDVMASVCPAAVVATRWALEPSGRRSPARQAWHASSMPNRSSNSTSVFSVFGKSSLFGSWTAYDRWPRCLRYDL